MEPTNVTGKTAELVEAWIVARKKVERLRRELADAEANHSVATNQLGCWLTPHDAHTGEQFNIWFGSGILQATIVRENGDDGAVYGVKWRKEPEGKQLAEKGA